MSIHIDSDAKEQLGVGGPGGMGMVLTTRHRMLLINHRLSFLIQQDNKSAQEVRASELKRAPGPWLHKNTGMRWEKKN